MSVQRSRAGRARPGGGLELLIWYLMRITGLGLFVLALTHFLILHVLYDPAQQDASWIAQVRWSSLFWRVLDWSLLMLVLFHAFMGVRTVVIDYVRGGPRLLILSALYLLAFALFAAGTAVVMTLPVVPK
ncbi:MAG: succinate dehydrogenase [Chloroflexi bacterium]|nr:succinate dehydrogenase [Chloroflexota bacterium]